MVAAGAGELLTLAVATTLGVPRAAADWAKRGPCVRIEPGGRAEAEDGSRQFLDRPVAPSLTGMLAAAGPAGLLPFDRSHTPAEWRSLRLRLKAAVYGQNLRRVLTAVGGLAASVLGPSVLGPSDLGDGSPRQLLVVGGPAGDDELLGVLSRELPEHVAVGRGRVAEGWVAGGRVAGGRVVERRAVEAAAAPGVVLGHRYAAAYGLALGWGTEPEEP